MWQTFYLWEQAMWRKLLKTAVIQRKPSNCFVFAAGRILSSRLQSSVNYSGRLKKNKHSYAYNLISLLSKKFNMSHPFLGCIFIHLWTSALFGSTSTDFTDRGFLAGSQVDTLFATKITMFLWVLKKTEIVSNQIYFYFLNLLKIHSSIMHEMFPH